MSFRWTWSCSWHPASYWAFVAAALLRKVRSNHSPAPHFNYITVSHDTVLSMSSRAGKALFPQPKPTSPLLWGGRLMMELTRGSVFSAAQHWSWWKTVHIPLAVPFTSQPHGLAQRADYFLLSCLSLFFLQRGASASAPMPSPAGNASRLEPSAAGAKTLCVNPSFQPQWLLTNAVLAAFWCHESGGSHLLLELFLVFCFSLFSRWAFLICEEVSFKPFSVFVDLLLIQSWSFLQTYYFFNDLER